MDKNAFDMDIYEIKDLFSDAEVAESITETLDGVLDHLGFSQTERTDITKMILHEAKTYKRIGGYEQKLHSILKEKRVVEKIPDKLTGRAELMESQISPHLTAKPGAKILDLGCGDGKVGKMYADKGYDVSLADIYKHKNIDSTGLPFELTQPGEKIPYEDNSFDVTCLNTVEHHSSDPKQLLDEAIRVTNKGGQIIMIESVYGVNKGDKQPLEDHEKGWVDLDTERQRKVNMFFDHFYNRVIHYSRLKKNKVNVPFNFLPPEEWDKLAESKGCSVEKNPIHLGRDQKVVPEWHTLHVYRKL